MKASPTGLQCFAVGLGCMLSTVLIGSPQRLPAPFRTGIQTAVDAVAGGLLWLWGQPSEAWEQLDEYCDHANDRCLDAFFDTSRNSATPPMTEGLGDNTTL